MGVWPYEVAEIKPAWRKRLAVGKRASREIELLEPTSL